MKKKIALHAFCLLLLSAGLSYCGPGPAAEPTAGPAVVSTSTAALTPTISPTLTATLTPSNTPAPIFIQARSGTLRIVEYGFEESLEGWEPESGYRLLAIRLASTDGSYADGAGLLEETEEVYVVGNDKSTAFRSVCCSAQGGLLIGFTTPATASTFTLYWPGNEPIELSRPQL